MYTSIDEIVVVVFKFVFGGHGRSRMRDYGHFSESYTGAVEDFRAQPVVDDWLSVKILWRLCGAPRIRGTPRQFVPRFFGTAHLQV